MTFNLRLHTSDDNENAWPNRVDKVATVIKKYNPVMFGIQEGFHSMLTELNEYLDDYEWVGEGREGGQLGEYSAIFYKKSKLKVVEQGQFWLSETPEEVASISWESSFPRICTWAQFAWKTAGNEQFYVFNTHLDHISEEARDKGIELIWNAVSTKRGKRALPAILTGDMNSIPSSHVIQFLRGKRELVDAYQCLKEEVGATFHNFLGGEEGEPIDYIFVTKDIKVLDTIVDRSEMNGAFPSDHYPIIATVSLPRR